MSAVKHLIRVALPVLFAVAVLPYSAGAEDGASAEATDANSADANSHEGGGHPPLNFFDFSNKEAAPLAALLFNFTAVAVIVYLLMKKPLGARFRDRKAALVKALEEADAAKSAAEAAIGEARAKMDAIDTEMAEVRANIISAGEKEAARITASAEAQAKRLAADTEMLIAQEVSRLAEAVRREVVEKIVAEAAQLVREKITDADREKISGKYLSELGQETQRSTNG